MKVVGKYEMSLITNGMQRKYDISEFYMLLKLGIWQSGIVNFWGKAEVLPACAGFSQSGCSNTRYDASSPIRKHLDIGLYLLDLSYIGKGMVQGMHVYELVVAVCRNDMAHLDALYNIQISNNIPAGTFLPALGKVDFVSRNVQYKKDPINISKKFDSRFTGKHRING